jgi:hypothetical protein
MGGSDGSMFQTWNYLSRRRLSTSIFICSRLIEEENLAAIPFAVLERRVGKKLGKIEINGNKILPDSTKVRLVWQRKLDPVLDVH